MSLMKMLLENRQKQKMIINVIYGNINHETDTAMSRAFVKASKDKILRKMRQSRSIPYEPENVDMSTIITSFWDIRMQELKLPVRIGIRYNRVVVIYQDMIMETDFKIEEPITGYLASIITKRLAYGLNQKLNN